MRRRRTYMHLAMDVRNVAVVDRCCGPPGRHCGTQQGTAPGRHVHGVLVSRPPCRHVYVMDLLPSASSRAAGPPQAEARRHVPAARRAGRFWRDAGARALAAAACGKLTRAAGRAGRGEEGSPPGHRGDSELRDEARNQCALVRRGWPLARRVGERGRPPAAG